MKNIKVIGGILLTMVVLLVIVLIAIGKDEVITISPEISEVQAKKLPSENLVSMPACLTVDGVPVTIEENGNVTLVNYGIHSLGYSAGINVDNPNIVDCSVIIEGGVWSLASDLSIMGQFTIKEGLFRTMNRTFSPNSFYIGEYNVSKHCEVSLGSSVINCSSFAVRGDDVLLNAMTSTINTTLLYDDKYKSGHIYNNVNIYPKGTIYGFVEGKSTFNELKINGNLPCYVMDGIFTNKPVIGLEKVVNIPVIRNIGEIPSTIK